ncbi:MAG: hypothetical protein V4736_13310 [Bdellovibrionota bacterium]
MNEVFPALWTLNWAEQEKLPMLWTPECGSTQDLAREDFPQGNSKRKLYIAGHQLKGRGRFDRRWEFSRDCDQLFTTWGFRQTEFSFWLPMRVGLSLYQALLPWQQHGELSLKAPNDLYRNDKKIGGLLTEVIQRGPDVFILIGLGLNVAGKAPLPTAGVLMNEKETTTERDWQDFLFRWKKILEQALVKTDPLGAEEKAALLEALNRSPLLSEKFKDIDDAGNLITDGRKIPWTDL